MSFGFGVGDFIAGAQLASKLCEILSDSGESVQEYQELITKLSAVQSVLDRVKELCTTRQPPQATTNALLTQ